MGNHFDRRGKLRIAADVIEMRVRIDDGGYRLTGQRLHLLENGVTPAWHLGIDEDDTAGSDEGGSVPSSTAQHVEVA